MKFHLLFLAMLLLPLSACTLLQTGQSTPILATVTVSGDATMTMTPFLPHDQATLSIPVPTLTLEPTEAIIVTPAEPLPPENGRVSILLLGSDQRPGRRDFRTDVFVLLTLKGDGSISLVSFPRDLYVYLPGRNMERINTAYEFGGFELVSQTLDYNFGFRPDHFVLTNFSGFISIIDSLGGVEVNVAKSLRDARTGFPDGFSVEPGFVHMDGETALWYIRSRGTSSDFDRLRRAQEVLVATGQKLFTLQGLTRIPELYQAFQSSVVTDLTVENLLALLPILQAVDQNRLERYSITPPLANVWIKPDNGAYLLIPDPAAIRQLLKQAMGIPE